jgi:hypothetical protein
MVRCEVTEKGDVPCYMQASQQSALLFSDIPFINHYQYNKINKMHYLLSVISISSLYMF